MFSNIINLFLFIKSKSVFFLIIIIGLLLLINLKQCNSIKEIRKSNSISKNNEKAFLLEKSDSTRAFMFTADQFNYYNDSIINKLNRSRKELKIKDKDLKQLQYLLSESKRTDTIIVKDTIFVNNFKGIDTIIGDEWIENRLILSQPNNISLSSRFKSEQHVITSYRKETIDPPKKCFIARLFQSKHIVIEVNVVEKNPYSINNEQKFVEIINNK